MTRDECILLASQRAQLLISYLVQFLSDSNILNGEIFLDAKSIDNQKMCTFEIFVDGFEKHLNTGIPLKYCDLLNEQIFNKLLDTFLESDTMGVSKYYTVRGGIGMNFDGVYAINTKGSRININFLCRGKEFFSQVEKYMSTIDEYVKKSQESNGVGLK